MNVYLGPASKCVFGADCARGPTAKRAWCLTFLFPFFFTSRFYGFWLSLFIVEFLFGFGFLSLFVLCIFLGKFLNWLHVQMLISIRYNDWLRQAFVLFVMATMFNLVRGGLSFFQEAATMMVVLIMAYGMTPVRRFLLPARFFDNRASIKRGMRHDAQYHYPRL